MLSRITEPTEGKVDLDGRVGCLLEVGTGFHSELTGWDNVFLSGAVLGMRRGEINRKFDDVVAFAEAATFLDTPVKHYSSGITRESVPVCECPSSDAWSHRPARTGRLPAELPD